MIIETTVTTHLYDLLVHPLSSTFQSILLLHTSSFFIPRNLAFFLLMYVVFFGFVSSVCELGAALSGCHFNRPSTLLFLIPYQRSCSSLATGANRCWGTESKQRGSVDQQIRASFHLDLHDSNLLIMTSNQSRVPLPLSLERTLSVLDPGVYTMYMRRKSPTRTPP